jgi:hypothetical protein
MHMTTNVAGIELSRFEVPVMKALRSYEQLTDDKLEFDLQTALGVKSTMGSAGFAGISRSYVDFAGERIGDLKVFALAPGDATGHDTPAQNLTFCDNKLSKSGLELYLSALAPGDVQKPRKITPRFIPVPKPSTGSELSLAVATFIPGQDEPVMFANNLRTLGIDDSGDKPRVAETGIAGEPSDTYERALNGEIALDCDVTITLGRDPATDQRFGDPGAIANSRSVVQVAAVLSLRGGAAAPQQELIQQLRAHTPHQG